MAEHYLLWAAPFLVIHFCASRRMLPLMLFGVLQMSGVLANDRAFILVGRILQDMSLVLALPLLIYFLVELPNVFKPRAALRDINSGFEKHFVAPEDNLLRRKL